MRVSSEQRRRVGGGSAEFASAEGGGAWRPLQESTLHPLWLSTCVAFAITACHLSSASEPSEPAPATPGQPRRKVTVDNPGLPLAQLTEGELERFQRGDALFEATIRESDGLGPLYVRDACSACHAADGRGPGLVVKVAPKNGDTTLATQLLPFGSSERPYVSAGAKTPLLAPQHPQLMSTPRLPPAVFGRGALEAIPDADLLALERAAQSRAGSARGRLNRLADGRFGRFGVKARLATLLEFTADALSGDMGVSSPTRPEEPHGPEGLTDDRKAGVDFTAEQVELLRDYVRAVRIPERPPKNARGERLFELARCSDCHVPAFETDPAYPLAALGGVKVAVYTDLLLHDMGQAFSDGLTEGSAGPREFRTAPLVGLRFLPSLLHDGRAKTVEEAILAHGADDSEGRDSVLSYKALDATEQAELVKFVEAL